MLQSFINSYTRAIGSYTWSCSLVGQVSLYYASSYIGSHVCCFQSIHTVGYSNPCTSHPVGLDEGCSSENLKKFQKFQLCCGLCTNFSKLPPKHLHFKRYILFPIKRLYASEIKVCI